jgi:hypothetical protein
MIPPNESEVFHPIVDLRRVKSTAADLIIEKTD